MTPKKYNSVEEVVDDLSESDEFKRSFRLTVQNKILMDGLGKIWDHEKRLRTLGSAGVDTTLIGGIARDAIKDADAIPSGKDGPSEDDIKWIKETDKGVKRYFSARSDPSTIQTDDKDVEVFKRLRMAVSKLKKIYGIE